MDSSGNYCNLMTEFFPILDELVETRTPRIVFPEEVLV